MKKSTIVLDLFTALFTMSFSQPAFDMVGFATLGEGTTGGAAGPVVTPSNLEELRHYAELPEAPYTILIDKEMNSEIPVLVDTEGEIGAGSISSTYGEIIQLGSNKTLLGVGDKAFLNRVGILIQKKSNIIIRNIKFSMVGVPVSKTDENKVVAFRDGAEVVLTDPDCISIQADSAATSQEEKAQQESRNIWIDHNEFFNEDPLVSTASKDRYDGLLDLKNNTYNVTISWNYFHDHSKGLLIGNSNSDAFDHKITFHHNYFENIVSRQPLIRYGYAHLFNNFITGNEEGTGSGTDVRINSNLLIENNHYDQLSKAVFGKDGGKAIFTGNLWTWVNNKMRIPENLASEDTLTNYIDPIEAGSFSAPYAYENYLLPALEVKETVTQFAGIGKIDPEEILENQSSEHQSSSSTEELSSSETITRTMAQAPLLKVKNQELQLHLSQASEVRLYTLLGVKVYGELHQQGVQSIPVKNLQGFYLLKTGNQIQKIQILP